MSINLGPNTSIGSPPTFDQTSQIKNVLGLGNVENVALSEWGGSVNLSLSASQIMNLSLKAPTAPRITPVSASYTFVTGPYTTTKFTAIIPGSSGNSITVAYAEPIDQADTTAAIVGNALTVTLATKARMTINGAVPGATNVTCLYVEPYNYTSNGRPYLENAGLPTPHTLISSNGVDWTIYGYSGYTNIIYQSRAVGQGANLYPNGLAWSSPTIGSGYPPSILAGVSSAQQVITAVNTLSALVSASPVGTVTGPVRFLHPFHLIGGEDITIPGTFDGQFYRDTITGIWYRWDGAGWIEDYSAPPVIISETPPTNTRTLWFEPTTARLHVYYREVWVATA
jgi:hypothetical protein